jgi:hypothetical protein
MNIPSGQESQQPPAPGRAMPQEVVQPQIQPQQVPETQPVPPAPPDVPTTNVHHSESAKMTFLLVMTIVLGLVAVIALVFALRMKKGPLLPFGSPPQPKEPMEKLVPVKETTPSKTTPRDFDPKEEVSKLDEFDLESIEEAYLNSALEE